MNLRGLLLTLSLVFILLSARGAEKLAGTPIGTHPQEAALAFDGDPTTFHLADERGYAWVGLDLGIPHTIDKVTWLLPQSNASYYMLGVFQGANNADFSDAVPIAIIDDADSHEIAVDCSRGFRYVRYVGPDGSHCLASEIEFYGSEGAGDDSRLWQITNLPTVVINTVNGEIPYDKEHDISSTVIIISDGGTSVLEKSETSIRERGNASREFPKKPWRIKFDKKQNVLDAPAKAKKWTLINNYGDKTLMRNMLAFDIARAMGMEYVPYCTPVDVVLNGEYKGCYQLCDQVEVNAGRVDIDEMSPDDISGEALTGGYLVEVDAYAADEPVWFRTAHYGLPVTVKSPDDDEITSEQLQYIKDYFNMLEPMMKDTDPVTGYRSVFDNRSFIQHMLVNELAGNTDAYWSTFMFKRRNDPLIYTGPVWDFDIAFNNDWRIYPVTQRSGNGFLWNCGAASSADGMIYFAQRILIKDPSTAEEILAVWEQARKEGLTTEWLQDKVDEYAYLLAESQRLNFLRWPILSTSVHMNPKAYGSFEGECNAVKDYIAAQLPHLDSVIGYEPNGADSSVSISESDVMHAPEFYTIDGIKVSAPLSPGLYVERTGSGSRKIIVR